MIRLTDEELWTKREVAHETIGTARSSQTLVVFGIPELYASDQIVGHPPLNAELPTALRSERGAVES